MTVSVTECGEPNGSTSMIGSQEFRDGMVRLGAAVNIVTTDGPYGLAGFTASAVCSVTDSPPTLLVCINRSSSAYGAISGNSVLCVNTLSSGHEELSKLFGGKTPMQDRFAAATWSRQVTGSPVLADAAVSFDCRITARQTVGSHDTLFCEIVSITQTPKPSNLVYFGRRYHVIGCAAQ